MMKVSVCVCLLSMASICHAAAIRSNGSGGGNWSAATTWVGGVAPGNGDRVTVVAGDVVTFDVNMSGWTDGIAGLTCNGTVNCSTLPGAYCLKTSEDVDGTGRIKCGSPETAYPSECTMIFDFDSKPNSFECGTGLILDLHCAQPVHPVVSLSQDVAAGQTDLAVDADVVADLWAPGNVVRIDGASSRDGGSEENTISPGGIQSGVITVRAGLVTAKTHGARLILVTRNVRIIGSTEYPVRYMTGGVLGCEISRCAQGLGQVSGCTVSGTISGCVYGVNYPYACRISAIISGCSTAVNQPSGSVIDGTISGCDYGVAYPSGCKIVGLISACIYGIYQGSGCVVSGAITGCSAGVYAGSSTMQGAVLDGNTWDLRRVVSVAAYNTLFGGVTENYEYDTDRVPPWAYAASYGHDGLADAFKAWTRGGVVASDVDVVPPGYVISYRHTCVSSTMPCFRQELVTVGGGQTLHVWGKILIFNNHDAWPPRLELIDASKDPLVNVLEDPLGGVSGGVLASAMVPAPRGRYYWQDVTLRYTNPTVIDKGVLIRCSARQAGDDIYEVWHAELETAATP